MNRSVTLRMKRESKGLYSQNMDLPICLSARQAHPTPILLKSIAPRKMAYFIKCLQMLNT